MTPQMGSAALTVFSVLSIIGISALSDASAALWYSSNYEYRKAITIDYNKVSGTQNLSNFPVLITITDDSDLKNAHVQADGDDIFFTTSGGTQKIHHEIESFSNDKDSGSIVAWVNVPSISYDENTVIYLYYGNYITDSNQNAAGTWNDNYAAVWHMHNDPRIDSLEFETVKAVNPDFIPVTGNVFVVAYSGGTGGGGDDGFLTTVTINSDGTIDDAVIDTLEFDTDKGATPDIILISDTIHAIVYEGKNADGFLTTVTINSDGTIDDAVIDTLEFDMDKSVTPKIIQISGTTYAIVYSGNGSDGFLTTVTINSDGTIDDAVIDTLEFDTDTGKTPDIVQVSGTTYAIAYEGQAADGFLKTVTINSDGTIDDAVIDTLEFDTVNGSTPKIIQISGTIFAVVYEGQAGDGFLKTVTIATDGTITDTVIDTLEFDTTKGFTPHLVQISGTTYAIAYEGDTSDGFLTTVTINSDGTIDDAVIDTLEFDDTFADTPVLIQVSGNTYAIAYEDTNTDGQIKSVQIADSGTIGVTQTDSTSNANSGIFGGAMDSFDQVTGKISGSLDFDGSNDHITISDSAVAADTDMSFSMWVNISADNTSHTVLSTMNKDDRKIQDVIFKIKNSGEVMEFFKRTADDSADTDKAVSTTSLSAGTWHHIVGIYNNTLAAGQVNLPDDALNLYVDGTLEDNSPSDATFAGSNDHTASLGKDGTGNYVEGKLDEIRTTHTMLSSGWIATEYNNQNSPSTFYSIGIHEVRPRTAPSSGHSSIPIISGIGLYKLDLNGHDADINIETQPADFGSYFPYAKKSNEIDIENHGNPGFSKRGQYFFTDGDKTSIPTLIGEIGKPIQVQGRIIDTKNSMDITHLGIYTNIIGTQDHNSSDTYIIYDKGQPIKISDPNGFFSEATVDVSYENGWFWIILDTTFAKSMPKSDIIIETWNSGRNAIYGRIVDAWEIEDPDRVAVIPDDITKTQTISMSDDMASPICKKDDSCYSPYEAKILQGGTIIWENEDSFIHALVSGTVENPDEQFDTVMIPGQTFEHTYFKEGIYDYFCPVHPWASGKVVVHDAYGNPPGYEYNPLPPLIVTSESSLGSLMIESGQELYLETKSMWFTMSGHLEKERGIYLDIIIKKPDGTTETVHVKVMKGGHFDIPINLKKWLPGPYSVTLKFQDKEIAALSFFIVDSPEIADVRN